MKKTLRWALLAVFLMGGISLYGLSVHEGGKCCKEKCEQSKVLNCVAPKFLKKGDKIALISPAYFTPMENVTKTAAVLREWGFVPVVGPNVGKVEALKYAGTLEERLADLRWALKQPDVKAIICNRGGYGAIHMVDQLALKELTDNPKWMVGYSDITTLHGLYSCAGLMSIHGTMSSHIAPAQGKDSSCTLLRDLLMGNIPSYVLPPHPQNIPGKAKGVLVGGNICTFAPILGSQADATAAKDIILFVEEVEESLHNIDRLFNMLMLNGVLSRCRGVVFGEFTGCKDDLGYGSAEAMLRKYVEKYNIPLLCGFPAGHDDVNVPLVFGAPVTIDVRTDGATLCFDVEGEQREIKTENCK